MKELVGVGFAKGCWQKLSRASAAVRATTSHGMLMIKHGAVHVHVLVRRADSSCVAFFLGCLCTLDPACCVLIAVLATAGVALFCTTFSPAFRPSMHACSCTVLPGCHHWCWSQQCSAGRALLCSEHRGASSVLMCCHPTSYAPPSMFFFAAPAPRVVHALLHAEACLCCVLLFSLCTAVQPLPLHRGS